MTEEPQGARVAPTPGPWHVHPDADEQHNIQIVTDPWYSVAIAMQNMDQDRCEVEANARLIADAITVLTSPRFDNIQRHAMTFIPSFYTILLRDGKEFRRFSSDSLPAALSEAAGWLRTLSTTPQSSQRKRVRHG